ncbi:hypothetical protein JZ751_029188 [Albula glossodonta]|uniref:Uncharacterized protein n=1 Tax=Albula glossodonta TaxID=121402 RepID=A0A8T2PCC7_9TELE|nr:hypothetical protein JZ751_029188 [Albula glossodonta]
MTVSKSSNSLPLNKVCLLPGYVCQYSPIGLLDLGEDGRVGLFHLRLAALLVIGQLQKAVTLLQAVALLRAMAKPAQRGGTVLR